jgi:hypothetical protein
MAITTYNCDEFTGGGTRDLDSIAIASLVNDDRAFVIKSDVVTPMYFDSSSTAAEDVSTHPYAVRPDDYSSAGVWLELYFSGVAFASGTIGSSGASQVGLNTLNGDIPQMQMFVDGTQSSQIYSGGVVTENAALNGTIDITEITGYIKRSADNEAMDMGSFEISAVSSAALAAGINYVCVNYNSGTPIITYPTSMPNHSTVFPFAQVYKDVNNHLHILQGGHNFLGLPWKVFERFYNVEGLVRASGMVTTEGTTHTHLKVSSGILYQGLAKFIFNEFDGDIAQTITGGGTGGTISANNTIVLDSGEGDVTALYEHGSELVLDSSSNSNDGSYHVESISWDGTNTTIVVEGTALNTGADTGYIHPHVFTYWNYTADNGWLEGDQAGGHTSIHMDVDYWNDITKNEGSQFTAYTANRYGTAWVYASAAEDSRIHVIYGQGNYTLAEAEESSAPISLPDIVNKMGFLIARITFQESAVDFHDISYPWVATFASTGASDHGGLAGLGDDDHPQYIKDSEFTQNSGVLVGTGAGAFAEETGTTLQTSLGIYGGSDTFEGSAGATVTIGVTLGGTSYRVSVTPTADSEDCGAIYVASKTTTTFKVHCTGTGTPTFDWILIDQN